MLLLSTKVLILLHSGGHRIAQGKVVACFRNYQVFGCGTRCMGFLRPIGSKQTGSHSE